LIKERKKTSAIKKNSAAITKLFEDLAKIGKIRVHRPLPFAKKEEAYIYTSVRCTDRRTTTCLVSEFPGAKQVSEGIATVGPARLSGPIFATFEKVSTLLPATATEAEKEQLPKEEKKDEAAAATKEKKEEAAAEEKKEEPKKEEATAAVAEEAAAPAAAAAEPVAAAAAEEEETSSSAAPPADQAAPEAAATPAETESAPEKAEEAPKQAA
jgi:hypothetical protein